MKKKGRKRSRTEYVAWLSSTDHSERTKHHHQVPKSRWRWLSRPCTRCEESYHIMFKNRTAVEAKHILRVWLKMWRRQEFDDEILDAQTPLFRAAFIHFFDGRRDLAALDRVLDGHWWSPPGLRLIFDYRAMARAAEKYKKDLLYILPIPADFRGPKQ